MSQQANEQLARQIAEQKLAGTGLVLCRGKAARDSYDGWRFAVRPAQSPDWEFTGQEMALMVQVSVEEVAAGRPLKMR